MYGIGGGRRRKSKKKAKPKKENWFERLKVDELKEICKATKLPVKGTKKVIIDRLMEDENTSKYGVEGYYGSNMSSLKEECSKRNLVQSGTKLKLVVRILQQDHGTNPEATAAATKRPRAVNEDGTAKKKSKPTKANLENIHKRVLKKIEACDTQKKYESHYGSKCHAPDLYSLINDLIQKECIEKGFATSDPLFALKVAKSALVCLADNFHKINRPGYDEDYIQCISYNLSEIVGLAKPHMEEELKNQTIEWIEELDSNLEQYGLGNNYGSNNSDLADVVKILKEADEVTDDNESLHEVATIMEATMKSLKEANALFKKVTDGDDAIPSEDSKMPSTCSMDANAVKVTDDNDEIPSEDSKMPSMDAHAVKVTDGDDAIPSEDSKMPSMDANAVKVADDNESLSEVAKIPSMEAKMKSLKEANAVKVTDGDDEIPSEDSKMPSMDANAVKVADDNESLSEVAKIPSMEAKMKSLKEANAVKVTDGDDEIPSEDSKMPSMDANAVKVADDNESSSEDDKMPSTETKQN